MEVNKDEREIRKGEGFQQSECNFNMYEISKEKVQ